MQRFSWRTCTVCVSGANAECRRHELRAKSGSIITREIFSIGLSKMQFLAFPGPELINREAGRREPWERGWSFKTLKMLTENEIFDLTIIIIRLQVFVFL